VSNEEMYLISRKKKGERDKGVLGIQVNKKAVKDEYKKDMDPRRVLKGFSVSFYEQSKQH
jgi:hypothetical protein